MMFVRRALALILMAGLAHFGMATVPVVHAHEHSDNLAHHFFDALDLTDHHDGVTGSVASVDQPSNAERQEGPDPADKGSLEHSHSGPQFAPAKVQLAVLSPDEMKRFEWPLAVTGASPASLPPPFKPPRTAL